MSNPIKRHERFIDIILRSKRNHDFKDKERAIHQNAITTLNRMQSLFRWEGLPETIPSIYLESFLQVNGNCIIAEHGGDLYAFTGGLGGEPDPYYFPTQYTVANPALNLTKTYTISKDCVLVRNDPYLQGLMPIILKYCTGIAETELSINIATINTRIISLISAPDDATYQSAKKFLGDIEKGEQGVIAENAFLDGVKAQPYGASQAHGIITNLIELNQYQRATLFNELGLNANYNMKRESLNASEALLNDDALMPLIDSMRECRERACNEVNRMFGTNIRVGLASSWEFNLQEELAAIAEMEGGRTDEGTDTETE